MQHCANAPPHCFEHSTPHAAVEQILAHFTCHSPRARSATAIGLIAATSFPMASRGDEVPLQRHCLASPPLPSSPPPLSLFTYLRHPCTPLSLHHRRLFTAFTPPRLHRLNLIAAVSPPQGTPNHFASVTTGAISSCYPFFTAATVACLCHCVSSPPQSLHCRHLPSLSPRSLLQQTSLVDRRHFTATVFSPSSPLHRYHTNTTAPLHHYHLASPPPGNVTAATSLHRHRLFIANTGRF
jgi:hypothetical protein